MILYVCLAALLPAFIAFYLFQGAIAQRSQLEEELVAAAQLALVWEKKQAVNLAVRHHFLEADHFYIDKYLEAMPLLEREIEALQQVKQSEQLPEDEFINKRLEQLTTNNKIVFTEGVVQSYPYFQETTEMLIHPIEVDNEDLQKILSTIEGVKIGNNEPPPHRLQLIVLDFKLEKKNISAKNQTFLLNLKLLKREYS